MDAFATHSHMPVDVLHVPDAQSLLLVHSASPSALSFTQAVPVDVYPLLHEQDVFIWSAFS
jgi:hypothetical protein